MEYSKVIRKTELPQDVLWIDCIFKHDNRIISTYAKQARGLMVRYACQNQVTTIDDIKAFNLEGYEFNPRQSSDTTFVFCRTKESFEHAKAAAKATVTPTAAINNYCKNSGQVKKRPKPAHTYSFSQPEHIQGQSASAPTGETQGTQSKEPKTTHRKKHIALNHTAKRRSARLLQQTKT